MAEYKKRKDGRYGTKVTIGRDETGKYIRKGVYANTIRELKEKIRETKNLHDSGVDLTANVPTVKAWAERWLRVVKAPSIKRSMQEVYQGHINKWLVPIHNIKISNVKQIQLQEILATAAKTLSQSSMDKLYNCIAGVFATAKGNGLTAIDITEGLVKPTGLRKTKRTSLIEAEQGIMNTVGETHAKGLLVLLIMYAGLRINEALALTWEDITDAYITINKTIVYEKNSNAPSIKESPKSDAGFREIPILPIVKNNLNRPVNVLPSAYVFEKIYSKTMKRSLWASLMKSFDNLWDTKYNSGGTIFVAPPKKRTITSHMLRHTYATILYDAGVDVKTAQKWLGHSDVAVTLGIYTDLSDKKETDSTDKLKAYFDDKSDDTDDILTTQTK